MDELRRANIHPVAGAMGRVEDRIRFGVADQDFIEGNMSAGMQSLISCYVDKTGTLYTRALDFLPDEDRESLRPSLLMGAIYYAHFKHIRKNPHALWIHPPKLLPIHKIWIAWRMWRYEKKAVRKGLPITFDI